MTVVWRPGKSLAHPSKLSHLTAFHINALDIPNLQGEKYSSFTCIKGDISTIQVVRAQIRLDAVARELLFLKR